MPMTLPTPELMAGVDVTLLEFPMLHNIALPETTERLYDEMVTAITRLHASSGWAS